MMCDTLYKAALEFHDFNESAFNFYLWPGYNSLTPDENGSHRVDLRVPLDALEDSDKPESIECGVSPIYRLDPTNQELRKDRRELLNRRESYIRKRLSGPLTNLIRPKQFEPGREREPIVRTAMGLFSAEETNAGECPFRIMGNPTSAGFWAFLTDRSLPLGSTHKWISRADVMFTALIFAPSSSSIQKSDGDWNVVFDFEQIHQGIWPGNTPPDWPALSEMDTSRVTAAEAQRSARDRYAMWFQTVFRLNPERSQLDWFHLAHSPATSYLERRKETITRWWDSFRAAYPQLAHILWKRSIYTHWYSLKLDDSVAVESSTAAETASLGSIMFFTNHSLDSSFLRLARVWIENIYLMMRELESRQASKLVGKGELMEAWSHELATELLSLRRKLRPAPASIEFQNWKSLHSLKLEEDPPFVIGFPSDLIEAQLSHLSTWLLKDGPVPTGMIGYAPIAALFGRACEDQIKYIPRKLFSFAQWANPSRVPALEREMKSCAGWLRKAFLPPDLPAKAKLAFDIQGSDTPRAYKSMVGALRVFIALFQNACKHAWNDKEITSSSQVSLQISLSDASTTPRWLIITIRNSCKWRMEQIDEVRSQLQSKNNGTEDAVREIGAPLEVSNPSFFYFLESDNIWRSTVALSTTYVDRNNKRMPWLQNG